MNSSNGFLRRNVNSVVHARTEKSITCASSLTSKRKGGKRNLGGGRKWLNEGGKHWLFVLTVMRTSIEVTENHKRACPHWRAECGENRTLRSAGARRDRSCKTTSSAGYPTVRATTRVPTNVS